MKPEVMRPRLRPFILRSLLVMTAMVLANVWVALFNAYESDVPTPLPDLKAEQGVSTYRTITMEDGHNLSWNTMPSVDYSMNLSFSNSGATVVYGTLSVEGEAQIKSAGVVYKFKDGQWLPEQ